MIPQSTICLLIYETASGLCAARCDPKAFSRLSPTYASTAIGSIEDRTVYVKYPRDITFGRVSECVRNWLASQSRQKF